MTQSSNSGFNHTAFKLNCLWHVGYLLDDFYGLLVCARASLLLFNPARRPDSIKSPRLLGSKPVYCFVAIVLHHLLTLHHSLLPHDRPRLCFTSHESTLSSPVPYLLPISVFSTNLSMSAMAVIPSWQPCLSRDERESVHVAGQ
jgi:hypothetical protein